MTKRERKSYFLVFASYNVLFCMFIVPLAIPSAACVGPSGFLNAKIKFIFFLKLDAIMQILHEGVLCCCQGLIFLETVHTTNTQAENPVIIICVCVGGGARPSWIKPRPTFSA